MRDALFIANGIIARTIRPPNIPVITARRSNICAVFIPSSLSPLPRICPTIIPAAAPIP